MKVIDVDMWDRENIEDVLRFENLTKEQADNYVKQLNAHRTEDNSTRWARAVDDDYRLNRGMEDLI